MARSDSGVLARLVGVLDAQDELPPVRAGKAEVEQSDIGGADMGVAGGGRGDAGANSHVRATFRGNGRVAIIRDFCRVLPTRWAGSP